LATVRSFAIPKKKRWALFIVLLDGAFIAYDRFGWHDSLRRIDQSFCCSAGKAIGKKQKRI
jgi:hypothetical protein